MDPEQLPDKVVCHSDSTIALPILIAYALARRRSRKLRRLYDRRAAMVERLRADVEAQRKA